VVNDTRTELAKEYLVQGGPSVTEIAFLLGYSELSAFDRAFRRETGVSPTGWRRG
jgi:AraC-like DNA-binding protein